MTGLVILTFERNCLFLPNKLSNFEPVNAIDIQWSLSWTLPNESSATTKFGRVVHDDHDDTAVLLHHGPFCIHRSSAPKATGHNAHESSITLSAKQNDNIYVDHVHWYLARYQYSPIDKCRQFLDHQHHFLQEWYAACRLESQQCH
jgi:hypothetical protein